MSEDPLAPAEPGSGPNRTFLLLLAGLGLPMVAAILIGLFVVLPRIGGSPAPVIDAIATETAISGQGLTRVAVAQATQLASTGTARPPTATRTATPTTTPLPTYPSPTPSPQPSTRAPEATATLVVSGRDTPTPLGTRNTGGGFVTPTPEGSLSPTGVSGETGGPLIIAAGFGLLLVLVVARKLRSA